MPGFDALTLLQLLKRVVVSSFLFFSGFTPHIWQLLACTHLLKLQVANSNGPIPVLLCRPTGGGKTAVQNATSITLGGGISLMLVPLLALAGDQTSKLRAVAAKQKKVRVYNLDEIKKAKKKRRLQRELIQNLDPSSGITVYLFSSPQTITTDKSWQKCFQKLIELGKMKMVTIDECHLYANFGMEFRGEFVDLKDSLFLLLSSAPNSIPVLFMTATGAKDMVNELEQLTGLVFEKPADILWPYDTTLFQRRNISLQMKFSISPLSELKSQLRKLDEEEIRNNKCIVYTKSVKRCDSLHSQARALMDSEMIPGDVVMVNGTLFIEQKFHNVELFVGSVKKSFV